MLETAEILKVTGENPLIFTIRLKAPEIASAVKPGQFVMLRVSESFDPLLRRPLSVMEYDAEKGEILLLVKVVGMGTSLLRDLREGAEVSLQGPLGNGFDMDVDADTVHLIAGGTGLTPLYPLAHEFRKKGKNVVVMMGTESQTAIMHAEELTAIGCNVRVATMDGSFGCPGSVCLLLQREAELGHIKYVYACGPNSLMQQVDAYCLAHSIPGQICLDAKMACGVGACRVCTCQLRDASGRRVSVCQDGPVFKIGEVEING